MASYETNPASVLIGTVARHWPLILVRGLAAIAFGILCFVWPAITLLALVVLYGVYAIVDGVAAIVWGSRSHWWSMMVVGAISVLSGLIAFFWPGITALALLYVIAAWAIVRGVAEIGAALHLRGRVGHEGLLALAGFVSILFGVLIALFPGAGALSVLWLIGSFAIVFGIFTVALALSLRTRRIKTPPPSEEEPAEAVGSNRMPDEHIG
jgi:uncharacterized membrane protein HdeD (DUF308 family)